MGLPPTSSKLSSDSGNVTTFNYQFPNFTGTHTGITMALGVNSVAGGGTGDATLTANNLLVGNGTSPVTFLAPGSAGNVVSSNGTVFVSSNPIGSSFTLYASSQVTTQSSAITSSTFVTASNSPAFSITPTVTGTYKVYCSPGMLNVLGSGETTQIRIFNTSGGATLLYESQSGQYFQASQSYEVAGLAQSVYTLTAGNTYVFDIQLKTTATNAYIDGGQFPFYMFAEGIGLAGTSGISLGAFGSTPNADGLSLAAGVLNMQPASGSFPGGVSTTTQTFAGSKTIGFNTSDVITIGAGSSTALNQINGGLQLTTRTVTASTFTVDTTTTDNIIFTDSTSNAITITLPAPTNGRCLYIADKTGKAGTNNVTINPHASETLNGLTTFVMAQNYASVIIMSDGTNWILSEPPTSGDSFLTSGTTYTTPANITPQTRFKFTLVGAGGAGAGNPTTAGQNGAAGGAGGTGIVYLTGLSPSTGYTIAIGSGGVGGSNTVGTAGGATTLNVNSVTYTAAGGGVPASTAIETAGGVGGTTTNMTIGITGQPGAPCGGATTTVVGSTGGSTPWGFGGVGSFPVPNGNSPGISGTGYGSGGSGSKGGIASATAGTGGNGAPGMILVEWKN